MASRQIGSNERGSVLPLRERDRSDDALVAGCQNGDRDAQSQLYEKYKDWIFGLAYRMSNQQQEAEDITQKVFIRVFSKIHTFRGDSAFSSWLYRLAMNICINHFRQEKRRRARFSNELSRIESPARANAIQKETFSLKPYLEKAIRALPEKYRMVFVLYDMKGFNHKEIGNMMNISEGTSKSQLHKARKHLKASLQPYLALNQSFS